MLSSSCGSPCRVRLLLLPLPVLGSARSRLKLGSSAASPDERGDPGPRYPWYERCDSAECALGSTLPDDYAPEHPSYPHLLIAL